MNSRNLLQGNFHFSLIKFVPSPWHSINLVHHRGYWSPLLERRRRRLHQVQRARQRQRQRGRGLQDARPGFTCDARIPPHKVCGILKRKT